MKVFLLKDFTYSRLLSCCNLHVWPGGGQVVKWLHLFELASNMVFLLLAKVLSSRVGFCSELCENVKLENVCSENKGGAKPSIKPFFWSSLCPPSLLHRTDLGTKSTNVWVDEGGGPGGLRHTQFNWRNCERTTCEIQTNLTFPTRLCSNQCQLLQKIWFY